MKRISDIARRLGLIINEDETFTSGGFTIYGKIPVFRRNLINLETKKWNRITCVTNDQIPTISNVMDVIGSTALGSAQYSTNFMKQLSMYTFYSLMFEIHNFANILHEEPLELTCQRSEFVGKLLFLDESLGGYTGISPTRFLVTVSRSHNRKFIILEAFTDKSDRLSSKDCSQSMEPYY